MNLHGSINVEEKRALRQMGLERLTDQASWVCLNILAVGNCKISPELLSLKINSE